MADCVVASKNFRAEAYFNRTNSDWKSMEDKVKAKNMTVKGKSFTLATLILKDVREATHHEESLRKVCFSYSLTLTL